MNQDSISFIYELLLAYDEARTYSHKAANIQREEVMRNEIGSNVQ